MPTFLACCRLFSLRDCGEAARGSLGGNLRVEGREETDSLVYSHPHPTEERRHAGEDQHLSAKGMGPYRKWNRNRMGEATENTARQGACGLGGTSEWEPSHPPPSALLALTSFRGTSPKRKSVFLLGTLSPRLSVLPHKGAGWGSCSSYSPQL